MPNAFRTHLSLGRVSNLPTVWTNVLAAGALAGATLPSAGWLPLLLAMSLFYIAGMYYNDVCDADYDAIHQTHRPIAAGQISRQRVEVFTLGYVLIGFVLVYLAKRGAPMAQDSSNLGWLLGTLALLAFIIAYDRYHKDNPYSPALMAGCRVAVLVTSSYVLSASLAPSLYIAILNILCWLVGLTYLAKHENKTVDTSTGLVENLSAYWPVLLLCVPAATALALVFSSSAVAIPLIGLLVVITVTYSRISNGAKGSAIALMIAGICLVDGVFLAWVWGLKGALAALLAFAATLSLQRWVSGT